MRSIMIPAIALTVALLAAPEAQAAQNAAGCEAAKLKACSTSALAQLKCHALAAKKGIAVDPACLTKAETKFRIAFDRIDSRGGCATTGDSADYEVEVDAFVADIVNENLCSPKIKAAGTAAKGLLTCYARSTKKSEPVDTGCLDKADLKLEKAFTKADDKGCLPTGGTAAVQAHADTFVAALAGSVAPTNIRIFLGSVVSDGALGPRSVTDAVCDSAAINQGLTCNTVVSLLSYSGDAIADFPANHALPTTVPLISGAADVTVATNWADFLDGTWQTCLGTFCMPSGPTPAGIISGPAGIWTGSNDDGTVNTLNCSDWTDTSSVNGGKMAFPYCYGSDEFGACSSGQTLGQAGTTCSSAGGNMLCLCY